MKTQVIALDPHDDVVSARDKISWAKTPRILLVYPRRSRILSRKLDLQLLQRHALSLGAQLAIVAPAKETRRAARILGVPVFKNAFIAQRKDWEVADASPSPVRRAPRPDLRRMLRESLPVEGRWRDMLGLRLAFFFLGVLSVIVLLLLFFPAASVRLSPETRIQDLTISANASLKATAVNLVGSLPVHLTYSVVERSKTSPVSGSIISPKTNAAGSVRFSNLTTGAVKVPSGTIVRMNSSPSIRFASTTEALVPAGVGKTVDVPVQAVEAGSAANLPAGSLVGMEGDLGTSLSVTNPLSMTGGSDSSSPVQTAADRTRLHDALVSEILQQCMASLPKSLGAGDVFFPGTLAAGQVISETYFPADGQTGETLSLTMNLQCQAQYASAADIHSLAGMALDANLPAGYQPVSNGGIAIVPGAPVTDNTGVTHWNMKAQRLLRGVLDPLQVIQLIQGRRPEEAVKRLNGSLHLAAQPAVILQPAWWPWLPVIPFRITVSTGE